MKAPSKPPPRPGLFDRMMAAPISPHAIERDMKRQVQPYVGTILTWVWIGAIAVLAVMLGAAGWSVWSSRVPLVAPQHRAEALCMALTRAPAFEPPMHVEPTAARVPGHFPNNAPPAYALQQTMGFADHMLIRQRVEHVGDFDVAALWLRIPETGGAGHWLVLAWMEAGNLEVASFRFGDRSPAITEDEFAWGERLLARLLVAENFSAAELPNVSLRMVPGSPLPSFGPTAS